MKNGVTSSIVRRDADISEELEASELHPLLKKIYANRGVTSLKQVDYSLKGLLDFALLKDIDVAAELVSEVIIEDKRIVVVGDFDADGATSCAVMVRSLRAFGLSNVEYLVPNRFDFGYGLSPQIVDVAAGSEPELIITVDNGISSIDGVRRAAELGIQVVVTDHHLAADVLPEAAAIVNPNQPGCEFPSKMIAGVGVA
ncbi:MAG: DHH family phosphoesterase, partial [Gammaproteobacteria bacterium]|nr:DHH family phosphoesterase [Gammaproteobacteria bacterium]